MRSQGSVTQDCHDHRQPARSIDLVKKRGDMSQALLNKDWMDGHLEYGVKVLHLRAERWISGIWSGEVLP